MDILIELLCWNMRGLNDPAKRSAVREFLSTLHVSIVCFQETKVDVIDDFFVMQCLGPSFDGYVYLPAMDTRGGILLAWDSSVVQIDRISFDSHAITGEVTTRDNNSWWLTTVYGPHSTEDKWAFLDELTERRALCPGPWAIAGDFNMILSAEEKNNCNLNRAVMNRFINFTQRHELNDTYLHGRLFTWSNERDTPTMTRIDKVLASVDWDLVHPDAILQALSSSVLDHAPIHLSLSAAFHPKRRFRFEMFWLKLDGFEDPIKEARVCDEGIVDPFRRLDALFRNAAQYLQAWGHKKTGNIKLQIAIANTVIFRLDVAQERRRLSQGELWLRRTLKLSVLGLASLERTLARQRSRIRWLREGDANSKLFHITANGRRTRNFIPAIRSGNELVMHQAKKVEIFTEAFLQLIGNIHAREHGLDLDALELPRHDLSSLEDMITEEEVWKVIKELPADRAPGTDGFIGAFYQRAWQVIKRDVMAGIMNLFVEDCRGFARLNRAYITLIPKRQNASEVDDFRPISLVHSFSKLFSKIMANRLRAKLPELVSPNQSAFVRSRSLHDNFMLVRQVARRINQRKQPGVLLKLDITRAFDSVSWSFLLEVLRHLGFGVLFLKWVDALLYTANMVIMVNGEPGERIQHACGLRQGDPTSPMLFVIRMEVLTKVICAAVQHELLRPLAGITPLQRLSVYADDVVLFCKLVREELVAVKEMLRLFGGASGLHVNYRKMAATLIRGRNRDAELITEVLGCELAQFPIKYLGLQLALRPLTKAQWQPMLDSVTRMLPAWQRGMITKESQLILIKSVLQARPIHHILVEEAPVWLPEEIAAWLRAFFWSGKKDIHGGECLVAWNNVCRPYSLGGLGVKDLRLQSLALRVRWLWLARTDPARPWQGLKLPKDTAAMAVFQSLARITVGSGASVFFWRDIWLNGCTVREIAPRVVDMVPTRRKNNTRVSHALHQNGWIHDIAGPMDHETTRQCISLWLAIGNLRRDEDTPDSFS